MAVGAVRIELVSSLHPMIRSKEKAMRPTVLVLLAASIAALSGCQTPAISHESSRLNNGRVELTARVDPGNYQIVGAVFAFRASTFGIPNPTYFDSNSQLIQPVTQAANVDVGGRSVNFFFPSTANSGQDSFFYQWIVRYKLPNGTDVAEQTGILHVTGTATINSRPDPNNFLTDTSVSAQ
jgi:hypothetical protein